MGWNDVKLRASDKIFSQYIRKRDKKCVRCGRQGTGPDGIFGLQASHYYSRRKENTRFDPENVDALCAGCHRHWGGDYRPDYKEWKIQQLGEKGFNLLTLRAHTPGKRDDKLATLEAKALLDSLK